MQQFIELVHVQLRQAKVRRLGFQYGIELNRTLRIVVWRVVFEQNIR